MANPLLSGADDTPPNPLMASAGPAPAITAAQAPSLADAYGYNADAAAAWLAHERALSQHLGLWNDATGLPTQAGVVDAARQYGTAMLMGSISPRVFHGTARPGMTFEEGRPAFFTTDPGRASFYAETGQPQYVGDPKQPNVIPAYLDMQNPKVVKGLDPSEHEQVFKDARAAGHDGVIIRTDGVPDTYVVFSQSQIKPGASPQAPAN